MNKKQIVLTEQDLHMLVEDAVRVYLQENGMDEGIWGGVKNVTQQGYNAVRNGLKNFGKQVKGYGNQIKTQYQQGSAQQDLKNVNNALIPMVQKGILDQNSYKQILGRLNTAIRKQGGQNMSGISK